MKIHVNFIIATFVLMLLSLLLITIPSQKYLTPEEVSFYQQKCQKYNGIPKNTLDSKTLKIVQVKCQEK